MLIEWVWIELLTQTTEMDSQQEPEHSISKALIQEWDEMIEIFLYKIIQVQYKFIDYLFLKSNFDLKEIFI